MFFISASVVLSASYEGIELKLSEPDDVRQARERVSRDEQRLEKDKEFLRHTMQAASVPMTYTKNLDEQRREKDKDLLRSALEDVFHRNMDLKNNQSAPKRHKKSIQDEQHLEKDNELLRRALQDVVQRNTDLNNNQSVWKTHGKSVDEQHLKKDRELLWHVVKEVYNDSKKYTKSFPLRVGNITQQSTGQSQVLRKAKVEPLAPPPLSQAEVLRCLHGDTPDKAMEPIVDSFKVMIAKLEELNKYDGSEDLMMWCKNREKDYQAAQKPFEELPSDDAPRMVKLFVKTNLWALHLAKNEMEWLCSGGPRKVKGSGRLEGMKEVYSTYMKSLECQPGDVLCVGGSLTGQRPLCNCSCSAGWRHGKKEACEVCTDLGWHVGPWGPCEDGKQTRELEGCECRRRAGLKFDVDTCMEHAAESPPTAEQACENPPPAPAPPPPLASPPEAASSAAPSAAPATAGSAGPATAPSAGSSIAAPPAPVSSLGQKDRTQKRKRPRMLNKKRHS